MVPTIEPWAKYLDILKAFGNMGEMVAAVTKGMDWKRRAAFARQLFRACVETNQDNHALAMLKLLERAVSEDREAKDLAERNKHFRKELEAIFWSLPDKTTGPGGGPRACLVTTKVYIVGQLIGEWTATELPDSVRAFRRLIAMGWPVPGAYRQRDGELAVEMKARGRYVSEDERKGICWLIRSHMDSFGSYEERKAGADAIFGPWLAHSHVPHEIRTCLLLNRAKMGGEEMARRDIRHAEVLRGLSADALNRLEDVIGPMRCMARNVEELRGRICAKLQERNRHWRQDIAPLGWTITFPAVTQARIEVGPVSDPDDVFADAVVAVADMHHEGVLNWCDLTLVVNESTFMVKDRTPKQLVRDWRRM